MNYNDGMAGRKDRYLKFKAAYKGTGADMLYSDWNDRAVYSLNTLINSDKQFLKDIEAARAQKDIPDEQKALAIIRKYSLQYGMTELLCHYIATDQINAFYMRPPVVAVSTKENIAGPSVAHNDGRSLKRMLDAEMQRNPDEWVYLLIDPECTQSDLEQWVKTYWKMFMQSRLDVLKATKSKRVNTRRFIKRDREIYEHIKTNKLPAKEIAAKYNLTTEYAIKIANRLESMTNKE